MHRNHGSRGSAGEVRPSRRWGSARRWAAIAMAATWLAVSTACGAAPPPTAKAVPEGSGCTNLSDGLGSGVWYGLLADGSTPSALRIDIVCYFITDSDKAAAEDGEEAYDFYVRNTNTKVRTIPTCGDAKFALVTAPLVSYGWVSGTKFVTHILGGAYSTTYPQSSRLSLFVVSAGESCIGTASQMYTP